MISQSRIASPVARQGILPMLAMILCLTLAASPASADNRIAPRDFPTAPAGTYEYEVRHGSLGRIGSYTNEIRHENGGTVVETEVDISAKVLFVRVAREKAERRQIWQDGRLVAYDSVTWSGSKESVTKGRAEGDRFVLEGPKGRVVGPAGLFPINPWSMAIVDAPVLMGEKNGTLHPIKDVEENRETIMIDGREVETRHFKLIGHRDEQIWFDQRGVAVRFATDYKGDSITFTLTNFEPAEGLPSSGAVQGGQSHP